MPRTCVYCGSPARGDEHGWPKWLQRWGNPRREPSNVLLTSGKVVTHTGWDTAKGKCVCTPCNEWMGRKFEDKVAPLFKRLDRGEPHVLTPRQQRRLAAWAYKTTLMLECTIRKDETAVTTDAYRRFRSSAEPPPHCSIAIGISTFAILNYHRSLVPVKWNPAGEPIRWIYLSLLITSHLFFHVLGDHPKASDLHKRLAPAHIGTTLPVIWPNDGKMLRWPLEYAVPREALIDIGRWGGDSFDFIV